MELKINGGDDANFTMLKPSFIKFRKFVSPVDFPTKTGNCQQQTELISVHPNRQLAASNRPDVSAPKHTPSSSKQT
jgi:hypothetical protein